MHNAIELGHTCSESRPSSMQMCYGHEFGNPTLKPIRVAETIQVTEAPQLETFTSPLLNRMTLVDDEPSLMSMIGGQEMVMSVPDDEGRIEDNVLKTLVVKDMYHPNVTPIRTKEDRARSKRECYSSISSSPPPACRCVWSAENCPQPSTPPHTCRTPDCTFLPKAPQVENIVDATISSSGPCYGPALRVVENAKEIVQIAELVTRPRTRSAARRDGLVIPESVEPSDSEEDAYPKIPTSTKSRAPRSSAARKLATDSKSRREPLSALNTDPRDVSRHQRITRFQDKNIEQTSSPACMSPSESRTTSSANLTSTLPTAGGTGSDEESDPLADLPDLVSSSFDSGDGRM